MTPEEHAREIIDSMEDLDYDADDWSTAETQAHALEADAELLGEDPREYAAFVMVELENLPDDEMDDELLRREEGAALLLVGD